MPDHRTLEQQYQEVRAYFVVRGTSLSAWCKANQVAQQNVRKAFSGAWCGPAATKLVQRVLMATEQIG